MVPAAELAGALDGDDVLALLDDAQDGGVAAGVGADAALGVDRDVAARGAEVHLALDLDEDVGEAAHVVGLGVEQVERDALGALRPDPGQLPELVDEVLDHAVVHNHPS